MRGSSSGTQRGVTPDYGNSRGGSTSDGRTIIKSTDTDHRSSGRSIGDSRTIQPNRDRGSDSSTRNNSIGSSNDSTRNRPDIRRSTGESEITKGYRTTAPSSRDSRSTGDITGRRDNPSGVKSGATVVSDSRNSGSRSTGYMDRNTYTNNNRVKSSDSSRDHRGDSGRDRSGWAIGGSFSYWGDNYGFSGGGYYSDGYYRGRGYYAGDRYWYCPPRYRVGVEIVGCHSCGYRSCRCAPTVYRCSSCCYHPCRCYSSYRTYRSHYSYYPSSYFNVNLGYWGSDWFGGFSFATSYPTTVVTEVHTVYTESVWVPGHYAYREETVVIPDGNKEWVPAVYEEYWDGDAWVRRLVSGGYWKTSPVTKTEMRRVWVEGYWTTR